MWAGNLDQNIWTFGTFTFDGVTAKLYVNCEKINEQTDGTVLLNMNTKADLFIGLRDTNDYFSGKLDDFRIYNRALSDSEIVSIYNIQPTFVNEKS